jgi:Sigma-54 interaction domain
MLRQKRAALATCVGTVLAGARWGDLKLSSLPTSSDAERAMSDDRDIASLPLLQSANLLLIGPDAATRGFLAPLMASLASPVVYCDGAVTESLHGPIGSLIVRDVGRLTRAHQEQLLEWLNDRSCSARVIATSPRPVFPDVRRGVFSDGLYYRLNTVTLLLNPG